MNLHEMFFETFPAIKIIFELGFICKEDDLPKIRKGVDAIRKHAKRAGCESENDEEILMAAASVIPYVFSENSRFPRKEDM